MAYNEVEDVLDAIYEAYQRDGPAGQDQGGSEWEDQFFAAWGQCLNYIGPVFKNEAFQGGRDWRIIKEVKLNDFNELRQMKFRQCQSMITRHFPLSLGQIYFLLRDYH